MAIVQRSLTKHGTGWLFPWLGPSGQYLVKEQPESHPLGGKIFHVGHVAPILQLKGKHTPLTGSPIPKHHLHYIDPYNPTVLERVLSLEPPFTHESSPQYLLKTY